MKKFVLMFYAVILCCISVFAQKIDKATFEKFVDYANCHYLMAFIEKNDSGKPYIQNTYEKSIMPELQKATLDKLNDVPTFDKILTLFSQGQNENALQLAKKINERKSKYKSFQDNNSLIESLATTGWKGCDLTETATKIQNEISNKLNEGQKQYNYLKDDSKIIDIQKTVKNLQLLIFGIVVVIIGLVAFAVFYLIRNLLKLERQFSGLQDKFNKLQKNVGINPTKNGVEHSNQQRLNIKPVSQNPQGPILEVSLTNYNFSECGGTSTEVTVTSNVSWTVTKDASATWLTTSRTSGSNTHTFTMTATTNNSGALRSAKVTVSSGGITREITVTQGKIMFFRSKQEKILQEETSRVNALFKVFSIKGNEARFTYCGEVQNPDFFSDICRFENNPAEVPNKTKIITTASGIVKKDSNNNWIVVYPATIKFE